MIELFEESCGDLGGYESDFLYLCSFFSFFHQRLKSPEWTFLGLRNALESSTYDNILRDVLRRCLGFAGRTIIGGNDESADLRLDRAISRLVEEKKLECSILFKPEKIPDLTNGFLSLPTDARLRIIRLILIAAVGASALSVANEKSPGAVIGMDSQGLRYFLLKDSNLEIGCWKESSASMNVELVATSTEALTSIYLSLRSTVIHPVRSKTECIYCNKKASQNTVTCSGCEFGVCHYSCLPESELDGLPWVCSSSCRQSHLSRMLQSFVEEIEPLQKAATRKRRRLAGELHALQIGSGNFEVDPSSRRASRARATGTVDYSFRDYDKFISHAIRKSEKKSDLTSSEEEGRSRRPVSRVMTREERMALRARDVNPDIFPDS